MRYDAAGRLVEDGEAEAEGIIREDLRRLYGYNAEGRLIEKTMYYYGLWMYRTTFGYNDQGDIIEERHQHTGGIIEESASGTGKPNLAISTMIGGIGSSESRKMCSEPATGD
jgi:hypothetical protein